MNGLNLVFTVPNSATDKKQIKGYTDKRLKPSKKLIVATGEPFTG